MGQAKQRGTLLERAAVAISRDGEKRLAALLQREAEEVARKEAWAKKSPEERSKVMSTRMALHRVTAVLGLYAGMGMPAKVAAKGLNKHPDYLNFSRSAQDAFEIGGHYNWKGQHERLIYMGHNFSGNGYWHQFALVDKPNVSWCEVTTEDLKYFEPTIEGV
jgi:hypothetical protein